MKIKIVIPSSEHIIDIPKHIIEMEADWIRNSYIKRLVEANIEGQIDYEWEEVKE
jgi:hypothetical protein